MWTDELEQLKLHNKNTAMLQLIEHEGTLGGYEKQFIETTADNKIKNMPPTKNGAVYAIVCVLKEDVHKYNINFRMSQTCFFEMLNDPTVKIYIGECQNDASVLIEHAMELETKLPLPPDVRLTRSMKNCLDKLGSLYCCFANYILTGVTGPGSYINETLILNVIFKFYRGSLVNNTVSVAFLAGQMPSVSYMQTLAILIYEKFSSSRVSLKMSVGAEVENLDDFLCEKHIDRLMQSSNSELKSNDLQICQTTFNNIQHLRTINTQQFINRFSSEIDLKYDFQTINDLTTFCSLTTTESDYVMSYVWAVPHHVRVIRILLPLIMGHRQINYLLRRAGPFESKFFEGILQYIDNGTETNVFRFFAIKCSYLALHAVLKLRFNINWFNIENNIRFGTNIIGVRFDEQHLSETTNPLFELKHRVMPIWRCKKCIRAIRLLDGGLTNTTFIHLNVSSVLRSAEFYLLSKLRSYNPKTKYEDDQLCHKCNASASQLATLTEIDNNVHGFLAENISNDFYYHYNRSQQNN